MKKLVILLSTYNGEKYIHDQLQSIYKQKAKIDILLWIRDDGSNDNTIGIIKEWRDRLKINLIEGENKGVVKSFLELLKTCPKSDYYAFCDQDDIWNCDKIDSAIRMIEKNEEKDKALLYFSNVEFADKNGVSMRKKLYCIPPKFSLGASVISNPCLGCTMVFNFELMEKIKKSNIEKTTMHDKLVLLIAILCGQVIYDHNPSMLYRQHDNNVMGRKNSFIKRLKQRYRLWIKANGCSIDKQIECIVNELGENIKSEDLDILKCVMNYKKNIKYKTMLILNKEIFSTGISRIDWSFKIRVLLQLA